MCATNYGMVVFNLAGRDRPNCQELCAEHEGMLHLCCEMADVEA